MDAFSPPSLTAKQAPRGPTARSARSQQVTQGPSRGVTPADPACCEARSHRPPTQRPTVSVSLLISPPSCSALSITSDAHRVRIDDPRRACRKPGAVQGQRVRSGAAEESFRASSCHASRSLKPRRPVRSRHRLSFTQAGPRSHRQRPALRQGNSNARGGRLGNRLLGAGGSPADAGGEHPPLVVEAA